MSGSLLVATALFCAVPSSAADAPAPDAPIRLLMSARDAATQRAWLDHARQHWGLEPRHHLSAVHASSYRVTPALAEALLADADLRERGWRISALEPTARIVPQTRSVFAGGARASYTPNDPYYSDQWGPACIDLERAWAISRGRRRAVIAVLDTGADLDHPDLAGNLIAGYDWVNLDAQPDDDNGHGSAVAGVSSSAIDPHSRCVR